MKPDTYWKMVFIMFNSVGGLNKLRSARRVDSSVVRLGKSRNARSVGRSAGRSVGRSCG
jgi:hypothetical protein